MRNLREILRLRLCAELSLWQIKDSQRVSLGVVQKLISQANALNLNWSEIEHLNDQQLALRFYPEADVIKCTQFQLPDWVDTHQELRRKGVTKHLLWEEYTQAYPNRSYSYPQYCFLYGEWLKKQKRSMRQTHKAGEKLFVDYAGQTFPSLTVIRVRYAPHKYLSRYWVRQIIFFVKPPGHKSSPTG